MKKINTLPLPYSKCDSKNFFRQALRDRKGRATVQKKGSFALADTATKNSEAAAEKAIIDAP